MKDWFDKALAILLSDRIKKISPQFDKNIFVKHVDKKVRNLELKDRVELIADELYQHLGCDYEKGLSILLQICGQENEKETGMFTEYYWLMPVAKYVEKYGLAHFAKSMKAIEEITKRNTGEYAIRPYLEKYPKRTLAKLKKWSLSKNTHVRRLASEGLRPRLPWAKKIDIFVEDPDLIIPILDNLKDDPSKYVQKSVANCINDVLKDNLDRGKELIEEWNGKNISKQRKWIIKHALRKLLKANDTWAISIVDR